MSVMNVRRFFAAVHFVRVWLKADMAVAPIDFRFRGNSGHRRDLIHSAGSILERIEDRYGVPVEAVVAIRGRSRGALASAACGRPRTRPRPRYRQGRAWSSARALRRSAARENCIRDIADSLDRLAAT